MRKLLRKARDNPLVLPLCVAALRAARGMGVLRSQRYYSHVPYRGIVDVDCGGGKKFRIRSRGHNIENGLYWEGMFAHEPGSMREWTERAEHSGTVLDIGSHSGVFALAAAAMGADVVHAFEPLPRVHAILEENIALNSALPIQAWPCAVGAEDGTATIFDPGGDAPTSASLSREFADRKFGDIPGSAVVVRAIDAFCLEHRIAKVDLIKIDVEGYEEQALRGMKGIVGSSKPTILLEVLPGQDATLQRVVGELWPGAYDWRRIEEGGGRVSRNVLLVPRHDDDQR